MPKIKELKVTKMTIQELRERIENRIKQLEELCERDLEEKDVKFIEGEITALNDVLYSLKNISK